MFEVGDVVLVRGKSWLSRLIQFFTRTRVGPLVKERKTWATHVEVVVVPGNMKNASVISADRDGINVRKMKPGSQILAYRFRYGADLETHILLGANEKVGTKYPVWRLVAHLLDGVLLDAYLFRRILRTEKTMVCSELAVWLFEPYAAFPFRYWQATPDEIHDWLEASPWWKRITDDVQVVPS